MKFNLSDFLPKPVLEADDLEAGAEADPERGGGHLSLRCGQMLVSAEVHISASAHSPDQLPASQERAFPIASNAH